MKGRAHALIEKFLGSLTGAQRSFLTSRFILLARVVPEEVTPETDDDELESRIEAAIARIRASKTGAGR